MVRGIKTALNDSGAKRRFYELYTEVSHYHDARVEVNLEAVEALAEVM